MYDENFNNEVLSPRIVTITLCGAGIGWRPYPFHRGEGRGPNNNFGNAPAATLAVDEGGEMLPQTELLGGGASSSLLLLMRWYRATKSHVVQQTRGHGGNTLRDVAPGNARSTMLPLPLLSAISWTGATTTTTGGDVGENDCREEGALPVLWHVLKSSGTSPSN